MTGRILEGAFMDRIGTLPPAILTIGHSNRTLDELLHLVVAHGVTLLVDVRTLPGSRKNPQFNQETLPAALAESGIGYMHLPGLGGLRRRQPDSPNGGWRNASFQGYADYMQTREFEAALVELLALARRERTALMCAEALPWKCHRSLIADALVVRGVPVEHILSAGRTQRHVLRDWARVEGTRVTYPQQRESARVDC
jgi:uncharacterized protein (DUF488 family)